MRWLNSLRSPGFRVSLFLLASAMIAYGLWPKSKPGPRETLTAFASALKDGHRDAALALFTQGARARADQLPAAETWTASPKFDWRIVKLTQTEEQATATLYVRDSGYFVEPKLDLIRDETGVWKIATVEFGRVDPRFASDQKRRAEASDAALAEELAHVLQDRPTVLAAEPSGAARQ